MTNNYQEEAPEKKTIPYESTKPKKDTEKEKEDGTKGSTEPIIEIVRPFNDSKEKKIFTEDPTKPKDPEPKPTPEPKEEIVKPFKKK